MTDMTVGVMLCFETGNFLETMLFCIGKFRYTCWGSLWGHWQVHVALANKLEDVAFCDVSCNLEFGCQKGFTKSEDSNPTVWVWFLAFQFQELNQGLNLAEASARWFREPEQTLSGAKVVEHPHFYEGMAYQCHGSRFLSTNLRNAAARDRTGLKTNQLEHRSSSGKTWMFIQKLFHPNGLWFLSWQGYIRCLPWEPKSALTTATSEYCTNLS